MPTLPWTTPNPPRPGYGPGHRHGASRLELRRLHDVPSFLAAALRIRRQMLGSPGALGVPLIAKPLHRTFWTLSAWQDQAALSAAVGREPHRPCPGNERGMTTQQPWPWPETMEALQAAPASHRILLDNDRVRVLEVVIEPGAREPEHTHRAASVMITDEPARIRYYAAGALRFASPARSGSPPGVPVRWMEPEGPHSVENTDEHRYHAIRVELK